MVGPLGYLCSGFHNPGNTQMLCSRQLYASLCRINYILIVYQLLLVYILRVFIYNIYIVFCYIKDLSTASYRSLLNQASLNLTTYRDTNERLMFYLHHVDQTRWKRAYFRVLPFLTPLVDSYDTYELERGGETSYFQSITTRPTLKIVEN